jgi:hypothetical protein
MKWLCVVFLAIAGCTSQMEALERTGTKIIDDVVKPTLAEALKNTDMTSVSLHGSAQGIDPGWEMIIEGYLVQGFKGTASIRARGVAGQISGATQGSASAPSP